MSEQIRLTGKNRQKLPPRLKPVYILWEQGEDLRALYAARTFYRHRRDMLKYGVDITHQRRKAEDLDNVIPMIRVLEAKPVPIPSWAYERGLVYCTETAKRRA